MSRRAAEISGRYGYWRQHRLSGGRPGRRCLSQSRCTNCLRDEVDSLLSSVSVHDAHSMWNRNMTSASALLMTGGAFAAASAFASATLASSAALASAFCCSTLAAASASALRCASSSIFLMRSTSSAIFLSAAALASASAFSAASTRIRAASSARARSSSSCFLSSSSSQNPHRLLCNQSCMLSFFQRRIRSSPRPVSKLLASPTRMLRRRVKAQLSTVNSSRCPRKFSSPALCTPSALLLTSQSQYPPRKLHYLQERGKRKNDPS